MYDQFVRGSRWVDMRPCLGNGGKHMLCHYSTAIGVTQGGNGNTVQEAIDAINRFMREFPGELVILDVNNESGFDTDHIIEPEDPNNGPSWEYPRLTDAQWRPILSLLSSGIERPCLNMGGDLTRKTMYDFIGDGRGCVATVVRSINQDVIDGGATGTKGQYRSSSIGQFNQYSDSDTSSIMAKDQITKLHNNRVILAESDARNRDQFFVLSWTLTGLGLAIQDMAAGAFTHLFGFGFHEFTPFSYPNVLYLDYVGAPYSVSLDLSQEEKLRDSTSDLITLALAVNLQIASQNCHVGGGSLTA